MAKYINFNALKQGGAAGSNTRQAAQWRCSV